MRSIEDVVQLVYAERESQDKKWGADRTLDSYLATTILTEEVGEVARAVLEHDNENLIEELVQVAAFAIAWLQWEIK